MSMITDTVLTEKHKGKTIREIEYDNATKIMKITFTDNTTFFLSIGDGKVSH